MGVIIPVTSFRSGHVTRKQRCARVIRYFLPLRYGISTNRGSRQFDPQWFSIIMGTGIVVSILRSLSIGDQRLLGPVVIVLHILNTLLFSFFLACLLSRYALDSDFMAFEIQDPAETSCLGLVSISISVLIVGTLGISCKDLDLRSDLLVSALWALWWLNVFGTVVFCFGQLNAL